MYDFMDKVERLACELVRSTIHNIDRLDIIKENIKDSKDVLNDLITLQDQLASLQLNLEESIKWSETVIKIWEEK